MQRYFVLVFERILPRQMLLPQTPAMLLAESPCPQVRKRRLQRHTRDMYIGTRDALDPIPKV